MSNILIIKHGSLGDIIQANGAIKDIKENFPDDKILLLTTPPYAEFMSSCPYIDGVLIDKRLPRWNLFYLSKLKKMLQRFSFSKIFDLQNSSRSNFYKKFFFKKDTFWSDSKSFASIDQLSEEKNLPVLDRMKIQLSRSGISKTLYTKKPDLSWALKNISNLINQNFNKKYILIFPFCSGKSNKKQWPYFKELIELLNKELNSKYDIAVVPGPNEIAEAKKLNTNIILNNHNVLNISELISIIESSNYVIGNDSAPAHISSHLNKKGLVLFGSHTTPEKVSMYSENLKYIKVDKLEKLKVYDVFDRIKKDLNQI